MKDLKMFHPHTTNSVCAHNLEILQMTQKLLLACPFFKYLVFSFSVFHIELNDSYLNSSVCNLTSISSLPELNTKQEFDLFQT